MEDQDIYGYDYELGLDEAQGETDDGTEPGLSALPGSTDFRDMYRRRLLKREEESLAQEEKDFGAVLSTIEKAKQRLLAQPTKGEELRNIAMRLTQPRKESDPRFYERRNLYTFLRDIGEYGGEQDAARKKAEEEALALDEMTAKYRLERAQKRGSQASQLIAQYLSKEPAAKAERPSEFERLIAGLPEDEQKRMRLERARVMSSRAPRAEKTEPDPDRPSSVVLSRISGVVNRELNPIKSRLGALNETRAAIADARTNPAQAPQVDRFFARLTGDSQLSQLEVNAVANAGSFPARISNQLSKFFTGSPTDLSLDDKARVLDVLEEVLGPSFNQQRNQLISQFSIASDISPEAVERMVGQRYLTAAERRRLAEQKKREEEAKRNESAGAGGETVTLSGGKSGKAVK